MSSKQVYQYEPNDDCKFMDTLLPKLEDLFQAYQNYNGVITAAGNGTAMIPPLGEL